MKRYSPTPTIQTRGLLTLVLTLLLTNTQAIACDGHVTHAQSIWIGIMENYGTEEQATQARKVYTDAHKDLPLTSTPSKKVQTQNDENSSLVEDVKKLISAE